jgi:hypothetical protein
MGANAMTFVVNEEEKEKNETVLFHLMAFPRSLWDPAAMQFI